MMRRISRVRRALLPLALAATVLFIGVGATRGPLRVAPGLATPAASPLATPLPVEQVEVRILQTNPVQVEAVISGYLADSCTQAGPVRQMRHGQVVVITLGTTRPSDAICAQVITPFTQTIRLEGSFPPGEYTLQVNDRTLIFRV